MKKTYFVISFISENFFHNTCLINDFIFSLFENSKKTSLSRKFHFSVSIKFYFKFSKFLIFSLEEVFYQFWIRTKVIFLRRSDQQTEKIISKQSQSLEKKRIWRNKKYHYGAHVLWLHWLKMQQKMSPEKIQKFWEKKITKKWFSSKHLIFFENFWNFFRHEKFRQWRIVFGWSRRVTIM